MAKQTKKRDDEVLFDLVEAGQSTQNFIEKYQNYLIGGVAAILILIGGYFGFKLMWLEPKEQEAIEEMYKAELQFEQDSFARALEDPGDGYLGFLDIADEYSITKAGNLANYYAGVSYLKLGRYDAAIEYLKDFKPDGDVTPILKFGAIGDAYSEMNEMDKAIDAYTKAVSGKENDFMVPYYLKKLALLERALQNTEEANKHLIRLKNDYPNSSPAQDVDKYITE